MSIENAARFVRFMKEDPALREKAMNAGSERFETVTREAGASCTAYQVVQCLIKDVSAGA